MMIDSIKSKLKKGVAGHMLLSGACKPISMIISYIYVPIVMNYLGVEKYGIWSTILTILSWISYFDIGIGNGLRNKLTESLSRKDGESRKLVSSAYAFISIFMIVMTIVFAGVASFVSWDRVFGVSDFDENLAGVVVLSVGLMAINFVLSICKNVLYSLQKAGNVSVMELGVQLLNTGGVLLVMRVAGPSLFAMALVYGMSLIIVHFGASVIVYTKYPDVCPGVKQIDFSKGKDLTNLGIQFFIIQICALILFTTDSLIISYLYGAANVTPYSTVNKVFTIVIGFHSAMLTPIWSAVTKAKAECHYKELRVLIRRLLLFMVPFIVGTIVIMMIFKPLTHIWLQRDLDYAPGLIALGAAYCILSVWCNTFANVANGLQIMKVSMITAIVQATVNIPLSLLFAEVLGMGSSGVLAGTVLSMVISAIVQPVAIHIVIKENIGKEVEA